MSETKESRPARKPWDVEVLREVAARHRLWEPAAAEYNAIAGDSRSGWAMQKAAQARGVKLGLPRYEEWDEAALRRLVPVSPTWREATDRYNAETKQDRKRATLQDKATSMGLRTLNAASRFTHAGTAATASCTNDDALQIAFRAGRLKEYKVHFGLSHDDISNMALDEFDRAMAAPSVWPPAKARKAGRVEPRGYREARVYKMSLPRGRAS